MTDSHDKTDDPRSKHDGYILPRSDYSINPSRGANPAADVIRDKLAKLYASEPDALQEEQEAEAVAHRSKHQQFMYDLHNSGKDLAQIQTEWHNYYLSLPDDEKHLVWQEFYDSNQATQKTPLQLPADTPTPSEKMASIRNQLNARPVTVKASDPDERTTEAIQGTIRKRASGKRRKPTTKQHLQSLLFGVSVGGVAVLIFLFGFFNEVIIAPFIQPARSSNAIPLIVSSDTVAPTSEPQVIIPKINVQIPIKFGGTTTDEASIENDLESGIVHYPTTSSPGQNGNSAYFGHSSNNIFNKGKYKFAFVLLHELVPGDTFYITKDSKVYAYKVFSKTVVEPSQVEVLNPVAGHAATATLITCDPPGTSLRRLVVVGDQISPDASGNSAATSSAVTATGNTERLAGNGQTLWGHFIGWGVGKAIVIVGMVSTLLVAIRLLTKPGKR